MFSKRRTWLLGIVALAALAAALACGSSSSDQAPTTTDVTTAEPEVTIDPSNATIMLERTLCLEICPQYEITILGDGTVHYLGGHHVETTGLRTTTIAKEDVRLLLDRFEEIGFANLEDNYRCRALFDGSRTITSLTLGDATKKTVQRCSLDDETAPLQDLEYLIDEVTDSRQWIGLPEKVIEMSGGFYPTPDEEGCTPWPCTNYRLTVYRDGRVEYEGFQNVDVIGTRFGEISETDVLDLVDRYLANGFFDLPPDFHCQVTGVGATTTSVFLRTRSNGIERCHGAGGRLEPVRQMEIAIAELVGLEQWVGERPTTD